MHESVSVPVYECVCVCALTRATVIGSFSPNVFVVLSCIVVAAFGGFCCQQNGLVDNGNDYDDDDY